MKKAIIIAAIIIAAIAIFGTSGTKKATVAVSDFIATVTNAPVPKERSYTGKGVFPSAERVSTPVPGTLYVLNTRTGKFHYPSCRDVSRMSEENRVDFFGTRKEVINRNYTPCGHCKP